VHTHVNNYSDKGVSRARTHVWAWTSGTCSCSAKTHTHTQTHPTVTLLVVTTRRRKRTLPFPRIRSPTQTQTCARTVTSTFLEIRIFLSSLMGTASRSLGIGGTQLLQCHSPCAKALQIHVRQAPLYDK